MTKDPEIYFIDGCGRCKLGGTPECKVRKWTNELKLLRQIVSDCGLIEEAKWGVPTYTYKNKNIVIVSAFKEYCALSFFKGILLSDSDKLLEKPGPNSYEARIIKFTDTGKIISLESVLKSYVFEAIDVEEKGLKIPKKDNNSQEKPAELMQMFDEMPALKTAFVALTPGRQKGYVYFFNQAKQSKTRIARIEKCIPLIMEGKGWNGR